MIYCSVCSNVTDAPKTTECAKNRLANSYPIIFKSHYLALLAHLSLVKFLIIFGMVGITILTLILLIPPLGG